MPKKPIVKCFSCQKDLPVLENSNPPQCLEGTVFSSIGHYGSVFDPFEGASLHIDLYICDACLTDNDHLINMFSTRQEIEHCFVGPLTKYWTKKELAKNER